MLDWTVRSGRLKSSSLIARRIALVRHFVDFPEGYFGDPPYWDHF
ncbi:MAG: hypothetical protein R6U30_04355 [Halomonas sp.]